MLNGFMKSKTSLPKSEFFLIMKSNWKKARKILIPSYHCFSTLQNFINKNLEVEEKYLTLSWSACVDTCEQCPKPTFIGPKCQKIPKPISHCSADRYHYLPASKMSSKMNNKECEIDDFQPRAQLRKTKLKSENDIQSFCDTFIVGKHLLLKHLNHLRYLKIKQEKREWKTAKTYQKRKSKIVQWVWLRRTDL